MTPSPINIQQHLGILFKQFDFVSTLGFAERRHFKVAGCKIDSNWCVIANMSSIKMGDRRSHGSILNSIN